MGVDVATGEGLDPGMAGIYDNYLVKKQILQRWALLPLTLLCSAGACAHGAPIFQRACVRSAQDG